MKKRELIPLSEYKSPFVADMDEKKELFSYRYAMDLNPQLSAEYCGITIQKARRWLKEEMVQKAVSDIKSKVIAQCELDANEILSEMKRAALFDMKSIVKDIKPNGEIEFIPFEEMDGRAIAEITYKETKAGKLVPVIKAYNKQIAQKALLDYITGANNTQVNVQVNIGEIKNADPESAMAAYSEIVRGATLENNKEDG